ncbi:MAG: hypothetical protein AAGI30_09260 [Planctomycetota bacterium]
MKTTSDTVNASGAPLNLGDAPMRTALARCARRNLNRVAIYGAGLHTRRMAGALADPPVDIVCIIDDDPLRAGSRLWNIPVVSRTDVLHMGINAIVLSSDTAEDAMWRASATLRDAGLHVIRLYDTAHSTSMGPSSLDDEPLDILIWPPVEDPAQWADHRARLGWALAPVDSRIRRVFVATARPAALNAADAPSFLDTAAVDAGAVLDARITPVDVSDPEAVSDAVAKSSIVLAWRTDPSLAALAGSGRRVINLDPIGQPLSAALAAHLSADLDPTPAEHNHQSRERFHQFLADIRATGRDTIANLFGTGPSLDHARELDFSAGVSIACNSMVRNDALLDHIDPVAVCCADPVFHSGPSTYAGEFRAHLVRQVRARNLWVLCPSRDLLVYEHHLPADVTDRLIGIPQVSGDAPNLDVRTRFEVTATRNVLTQMLIPVACSFAKALDIVGCDGRPLDEDEYFWSHNAAAQLEETKMNDAQRAHPGFFSITYNDYYRQHCDTLSRWLDAAELIGTQIRSRTFSHIPALASRATHELAHQQAGAA